MVVLSSVMLGHPSSVDSMCLFDDTAIITGCDNFPPCTQFGWMHLCSGARMASSASYRSSPTNFLVPRCACVESCSVDQCVCEGVVGSHPGSVDCVRLSHDKKV